MHKYIRKYQDKNGKWVYVYHEHGLSPKNMTINEFHEKTAKEPSLPVIEHEEHEKDLPIERVIMSRNIEQNPHMPQADYVNARLSAVPNVGEDIVGAARHKAVSRKISDMKLDKDGEISPIPAKVIKESNPIDVFTPLDQKSLNPFDVLYAHECFEKLPGYKPLEPKMIKPDKDAEKANKEHYESYVDMIDMALKYLNGFLGKKSGSEPLFQKESAKFISDLNRYVKDRKAKGMEYDYETYKTLYNSLGIVKKTSVTNALNNLAEALSLTYRSRNAYDIIAQSVTDDRAYKVVEHILNGKKINTAVDIVMHGLIVEETDKQSKPKKEKKKAERKTNAIYIRTGPEYGSLPKENDIEGNIKFAAQEIGFRAIQWGNSVTDSERKFHLNAINTAMKDLCETLGLPISMGSYNGKIGIAIGARGKGTAKAHYEPSKAVINLTRASGAGSLAHEWFHAIDNFLFRIISNEEMGEHRYLSRFNRIKTDNPEYATVVDSFRKLVDSNAFETYRSQVVQYIAKLGFSESRIRYFGAVEECVTRAFESYLSKKMQSKGIQNNYLVRDEKLVGGIYPSEQISEKLEPLFDKLFDSLKNTDLLKKFELFWG